MSSTSSPATDSELTMSSAIDNIGTLKSWRDEHFAMDDNGMTADCAGLQALKCDKPDYAEVDRQVQHLLPPVNVVHGFCADCLHLLDNWPVSQGETVGRHFSTRQIQAAARAGCRFCVFLERRLEVNNLLRTFRPGKIETRLPPLDDSGTALLNILNFIQWGAPLLRRFNGGISAILWLNLPTKLPVGLLSSNEVCIPTNEACLDDIVHPAAGLREDPVDSFALAKTWLARCVGSHSRCHSTNQQPPPTRLVSLGSSPEDLKLVITAELETVPRYATLSYCWGLKPFTMLTQDKLPSFLDKIQYETLPVTFVDAITATRKLGLTFLWIDALCILQQEPDNVDWTTEAGRMRSTYGGAYVNLAASTATTVHDGFLRRREDSIFGAGFTARVTAGQHCAVHTFYSQSLYEEMTTETHLAGRAWTFQERLLPVRTIYFSDIGLSWECRSHFAVESLPDGIPGVRQLPGNETLVRPEDTAWDWDAIVKAYSDTSLTYGSDRLPALSGIAARQQEVTGDDYLAGMWKRSLVTQLPWCIAGAQRSRPKWRAPSWSWMSIDGQVEKPRLLPMFEKPTRQLEYIQVLDAATTPKASSLDVYGEVINGKLTLLCAVVLVRGHLLGPKKNPRGSWASLFQVESGQAVFPVVVDCLEDVHTPEDPVVYLLPVRGEGVVADSGQILAGLGDQVACEGLVLRSCSDSEDRFTRVGYFRISTAEATSHIDIADKAGALKLAREWVLWGVFGATTITIE